MNFRLYYLNLSSLQKIELYLIPLFIIIFLYFNIEDKEIVENQNDRYIIEKEIKLYQQKIKDFKKENIPVTQIEILKQYESLSQYLKIDIIDINFNKNILKIECTGKYINSINFLSLVEKMNKILSFNCEYKENKLFINGLFDISRFTKIDIENIILDKNIANPFSTLKDKNITIDTSLAIIGDYVLIEGDWYKVGGKYRRYTIKKIYNDYIELEFGSEIKKMEIFKE